MPTASSLLLGVLLAIWLPAAWDAPAAGIVGLALALSFCTAWWRPMLFIALGFFLALQAAGKVLGGQVSCDDRVLGIGRIVSVPERQPGGWQVDALLHFLHLPARADVRVRVNGSNGSMPRPQPGEHWQFALQLRGSAGQAVNPQHRRALLRDGVSIEARTLSSPLNQRLEVAGQSLLTMRQYIASRIDNVWPIRLPRLCSQHWRSA